MKTHLHPRTTLAQATRFQRGVAALAALLTLAAVGIALAHVRYQPAPLAPAPRVGSPAASAHEQFAALKQRQLDRLDARQGQAITPASAAASERFRALKAQQLARLDAGMGNAVAAPSAARERFQALK